MHCNPTCHDFSTTPTPSIFYTTPVYPSVRERLGKIHILSSSDPTPLSLSLSLSVSVTVTVTTQPVDTTLQTQLPSLSHIARDPAFLPTYLPPLLPYARTKNSLYQSRTKKTEDTENTVNVVLLPGDVMGRWW
jgi:hypothetical protein